MPQKKKQKVVFTASKKVSKPVKVAFYTKGGEKVVFSARKQVTKPVRVAFYVRKKK